MSFLIHLVLLYKIGELELGINDKNSSLQTTLKIQLTFLELVFIKVCIKFKNKPAKWILGLFSKELIRIIIILLEQSITLYLIQ